MSYLQNNECFRGTGDKNKAGQTLEQFLEAYNPKKYDCPSNTVDMAVFQKPGESAGKCGAAGKCSQEDNGQLSMDGWKLLMIRRGNHPNIGYWALPGGFVELRENLEDAAARELREETGVADVALAQIGCWGNYDRDPRWRVITTLFASVIDSPKKAVAGDDAAGAGWFDIDYSEETLSDDSRKVFLHLQDTKSGVTLEAAARRWWNGNELLGNWKYELLSSSMFAGDHALLVMDAIRYLRERRELSRITW